MSKRTPAIRCSHVALLPAALLLLLGGHARATVQSGASDAFGEQVTLALTPVIGAVVDIDSGPLPYVSGTAPAPYDQTGSLASATVAGVLSTGLLSVEASSTVANGTGGAAAYATVNGLGIALLSLLGINATTVASSATASGTYGNLSSLGLTTITGLSIAGLGPFGATITPSANDVVLNAGGITVTLNRQVVTNSAGFRALTVDAIAVDFLNVAATINGTVGLLTGEIDIAQSTVSLIATADPVPEPATLALFAFAAAATLRLSRNRKGNARPRLS